MGEQNLRNMFFLSVPMGSALESDLSGLLVKSIIFAIEAQFVSSVGLYPAITSKYFINTSVKEDVFF